MKTIYFPGVTLLITHYNRSKSLERLLSSFFEMNITFEDIVVSDDGSKETHLQYISELHTKFNFRLITTPNNKGLGNNINKGQQAVNTPYILYIQEDFDPKPAFLNHFKIALGFMKKDGAIDIIRFYAYFSYPYLKPYGGGYSEMIFNPSLLANDTLKFYIYSDHPHLKRNNFSEKFGPYKEGVKGDTTEYLMALSFLQKKGKGLFFENFTDLFWQKNSVDEPSTMLRKSWRESNHPVFLGVRKIYLQFKLWRWTKDYFFKK